jgi:threonine/homoserine/homoserine lactone efflux protein
MLFLKGLISGFSIAAPIGPVAILCIRRTITRGRVAGFVSGLGAATSDALSASIAAFGLTVIMSVIINQQHLIRLIGAVFFLFLGIKLFFSASSNKKIKEKKHSMLVDYTSAFLLTASNPMTALAFIAVFAGLGVGISPGFGYADAVLTVAGVLTGAILWWFSLSMGISVFRLKFSEQAIKYVNRVSGLVIFVFGIAVLISLLFWRVKF